MRRLIEFLVLVLLACLLYVQATKQWPLVFTLLGIEKAEPDVTYVVQASPPPPLDLGEAKPEPSQVEYLPSFNCTGASIGKIEREKTTLYKWVDDKGISHFSDRAPEEDLPSETTTITGERQPFELSLEVSGRPLPAGYAQSLEVKIRKVHEVLETMLPTSMLRKVDLQLFVFSEPSKYRAFRNKHAPSLGGGSVGFHSSQGNIAAVLYLDESQLNRTSIHETVHVMNLAMYGHLPRWLGEGLAEYFEEIETRAQSSSIAAKRSWMKHLQRKKPSIERLLRSRTEDWADSQRNELYAQSWGFVYFMLSDSQRKRVLSDILQEAAAAPCEEVPVEALLKQRYRGGIDQLQRDFARFAKSRPVTHQN